MEQLEQQESLKDIVYNLHNYKTDTILLRRGLGKSIDVLSVKEQFAYFEVTNGTLYFSKLTEKNWFITTLLASQLELNQKSINMEIYLQNLYQNKKTTESIKKRITKLLEKKTSKRFFKELNWFIKHANKNNYKINEFSLYKDISNWNNCSYKWAKTIVSKKGTKKND